MPRYLKVRGTPGVLVANPHVLAGDPSARVYAGRAAKAVDPSAPLRGSLIDHFDICDEVLIDHPHLRDAGVKGDLDVSAPIVAATHAEAVSKFAASPKPTLAKRPTAIAADAAPTEVK